MERRMNRFRSIKLQEYEEEKRSTAMASSSAREKLVALAFQFVATLNGDDIDAIMSLRTENCLIHQCCPSFDIQPLSNKEARASLHEWKQGSSNIQFKISDERIMVVDEVAKRIAFNTRHTSDTIAGPYENDYLFILQATDDCALVDGIWQFFDMVRKQDLLDRLASKQVSTWSVDTAPEHDKGLSAKIEPKAAA